MKKRREKNAMATWSFYCSDNGGKKQFLKVKADSKTEAINKGFTKAKKQAKGDIHNWECKLISA